MSVQDQILHAIDAAADRVIEASRQIHDHPELRFQEHFAAKTLTGKAMALTAYDLLTQPDFLAVAKAEWAQHRP